MIPGFCRLALMLLSDTSLSLSLSHLPYVITLNKYHSLLTVRSAPPALIKYPLIPCWNQTFSTSGPSNIFWVAVTFHKTPKFGERGVICIALFFRALAFSSRFCVYLMVYDMISKAWK
jgi:hypothetical protein